MRCSRPVPLVATLLLASGCEEQEAVPASQTVPVGALQLAVLAAVVVGGWLLCERRRPARAPGPRPAPANRELRWALAGLLGLAATAVVGFTALLIGHGAFGYADPTTQVFSWGETVGIAWWCIALGGVFALGELRLAAAVVRGSSAAAWAAGAQVALVVVPSVLGAVAPA